MNFCYNAREYRVLTVVKWRNQRCIALWTSWMSFHGHTLAPDFSSFSSMFLFHCSTRVQYVRGVSKKNFRFQIVNSDTISLCNCTFFFSYQQLVKKVGTKISERKMLVEIIFETHYIYVYQIILALVEINLILN